MKNKVFALLTLIAFSFVIAGCATIPEEHQGAATGAGVGAATGAVAGAVLGGSGAKTETAVIGGLLGALLGGAIGHYTYDAKKTRQETEQKYGYQPSQGTMVRIENTSAEPAMFNRGEKTELVVTYALLGASPDAEYSVTEIREIRLANELVGKPEVNVMRKGGTFTSKVPLFLPPDAKAGTYRVITTVQTAGSKDSRETSFMVH
ncbi:MAG: 17 kDa surface antigen [Nitrospirae bacterium]|jgi:hypothetical protein|nr:17 kDa surface antigen [Nitrospirota bacterium]